MLYASILHVSKQAEKGTLSVSLSLFCAVAWHSQALLCPKHINNISNWKKEALDLHGTEHYYFALERFKLWKEEGTH